MSFRFDPRDGSSTAKNIQVNEEIRQFNLSLYRSVSLLHYIGYGLLLFGSLDLLSSLFVLPLQEGDALLQFLAKIANGAPVLLVGLGFIFWGERRPRYLWELPVLKWMSWVTLGLSLLYLGSVPLGIYGATRSLAQYQQVFQQQTQQQQRKLLVLTRKIETSNSRSELEAIATASGLPEFLATLNTEAQTTPALKVSLTEQIQADVKTQQAKLQNMQQENSLKTLTNVVQWSIIALGSSALFWLIWRLTAWARLPT